MSNIHTQLGHASAEAILLFLEGDILPAGVDVITRADIKRVLSASSASALDPNLYVPEQLSHQMSSSTNQSTLMFSTSMEILYFLLCALISSAQQLFIWLTSAHQIYEIRSR
jgi:hypothetical protein